MFRCWRPNVWAQFTTAVGVLAGLLAAVPETQAAVTLTPDKGYGTDQQVFTYDPYDLPLLPGELPEDPPRPVPVADRSVTDTRHLRQTFKNPTEFNVGEIVLSMKSAGNSPEFGIALRIYEIADVLAEDWNPLGPPIKEIVVPDATTTPLSAENLSFSLTGGDVFTLPARFAGTTGYGIDISTAFANDGDGTSVSMLYHNDSATTGDQYADGRWYRETGVADGSTRDIGLALLASSEIPAAPGDVNRDTHVDEFDLGIIAAHFRQIAGRDDGDLTGNGFVDFDDFGQWKQHYNGPALGSAAFAFLSVPEPGTMSLLLISAAGLRCRARRSGLSNVHP